MAPSAAQWKNTHFQTVSTALLEYEDDILNISPIFPQNKLFTHEFNFLVNLAEFTLSCVCSCVSESFNYSVYTSVSVCSFFFFE